MLKKRLAVLLVLVFTVVGCTAFQTAKDQPFSTWSPKKKLTYAADIYSTEYDKFMAAVLRPNLTEGQKQYLKAKRNVLIGLDKVINLLIPIVDVGGQIPPDLESQLISWLTQLGYAPM